MVALSEMPGEFDLFSLSVPYTIPYSAPPKGLEEFLYCTLQNHAAVLGGTGRLAERCLEEHNARLGQQWATAGQTRAAWTVLNPIHPGMEGKFPSCLCALQEACLQGQALSSGKT